MDGIATNGDTLIYLSRQGANPYIVWTVGGAAFDTTPTLQFHCLAHYAGSLWGGYLNAGQWRIARATSGSAIDGAGYPIIGKPAAMITGRDGIYTGTPHGLWLTKARASGTAGNALDVDHQQLVRSEGSGRPDDWAHLCDHQGQLYAWYNGGVHRYEAGGSAPERMVPLGLWGGRCYGLAAAGGYLIAAVRPEQAQFPYAAVNLWAWDGLGWWQLSDDTYNANGVIPSGGYLDDATVIASDDDDWRVFQLRPLFTQPGYRASGELVTSLWHDGAPDAEKLWTRVGAEIGSLAYRAFGACTAYLDYSLDGSAWSPAGSLAVASTAPGTIVGTLPGGVRGKALALRYRLAGVTTGSPVLRALWAEYRPIEEVVPKLHWQFDVLVGDGQVLRNSRAEARTGKQIAADLWGQWAAKGHADVPRCGLRPGGGDAECPHRGGG